MNTLKWQKFIAKCCMGHFSGSRCRFCMVAACSVPPVEWNRQRYHGL